MRSRSRPSRMRTRKVIAAVAALASTVAGCGSSNAAHKTAGNGKEFIIDLNGPLSDPYFGAMKMGSDAAAKAFGVRYQYTSTKDESNFVAEYSPLIQNAIARHPSAIIIGNFVPSAFDPLIKRAVAAGIPVVEVDTGADTYQADGAVGFVGTNRPQDGAVGGQEAVKAGIRHLVCVNHAPVNPTLHQMCAGAHAKMTAAGATMDEMNIPIADSSNPSLVTQDIQGYLRAHPGTDGVLTLGTAVTMDAIAAVKRAGKSDRIKIGAFTLSTAEMQAIKTNDLAWVVDAQQYLQGYYSMQIAVQQVRYGMHPSQPIYTGGLVIDKRNVDQALAVQQDLPGIRGAS